MKIKVCIIVSVLIYVVQACNPEKKSELQKKWVVKDAEYKLPGWHADPIGLQYESESDVLTISNEGNNEKYKYKRTNDSLTIWNATGENGAYKISELKENKLILENDLVKMLLLEGD